MMEESSRTLSMNGSCRTAPKYGAGPFVYGYGITIGLDRKPQIRESGNVKPEAKPRISILLCRWGFLLHVLLSLE